MPRSSSQRRAFFMVSQFLMPYRVTFIAGYSSRVMAARQFKTAKICEVFLRRRVDLPLHQHPRKLLGAHRRAHEISLESATPQVLEERALRLRLHPRGPDPELQAVR